MIDNQVLNSVSNFFRAKGIKITISNQWLEGCISFCRSENPNANLNEIQAFVFDQWLLADLCDVAEPCLPPNLANRHFSMLQGSFALQVNEVLNVGQSSYTQLQKLRKLATENAEVNDNKPTAQSWEPKGGRMLRLSTTDGAQKVIGMEYKPIKSLQEPFVPGFKIIIKGPIECRKGVLLLEEKHITVCGGEVDTLVIQNSLENLLLKSLNLETVANPTNFIGVAQTQRLANNDDRSQFTQPPPLIRNEPPPARNPSLNLPLTRTNPPAPTTRPSSTTSRNSNSNTQSHRQESNEINQDFFDGFLDDDDDDDLLAQHLDQVAVEENNAINDSMHLLSDEDEAFLQVDDNLLDGEALFRPGPDASSARDEENNLQTTHNYSYLDMPSSSRSFHADDTNISENRVSKKDQSNTKDPTFKASRETNSLKTNTYSFREEQNPSGSKTSCTNSFKQEPLSNSEKFQNVHSQLPNQLPCDKKIKDSHSQVEKKIQSTGTPNRTLRLPDLPFLKRNASSPLEESAEKYPSEKIMKGSSSSTNSSTVLDNDMNAHRVSTSRLDGIVSVYDLLRDPSASIYIKAEVKYLTSKLTIKDKKWTLSAMISDGAEELKVDFLPEVLEKLAGCPAVDIVNQKEEIARDPVLKDRIRDVLSNAKTKVSSLKGKMKITLPNALLNPVVTEVIEE